MNRGQLSNTLRKLGLLLPFDKLRYRFERWKNESINCRFRSDYPKIALPPDYLMYESFQINYAKYYHGGRETAEWILDQVQNHKKLGEANILDWGCGPGRVVRHLPALLDHKSRLYGTDYNEKSIDWCRAHIENVEFNLNTLEAELPYENNFFDLIYGISIFTHLSEEMHFRWFNELKRITKKKGIIFITTQGDHFKAKLSNGERTRFDKGELIVRGRVSEGHRTYSAFHPDKFLRAMFNDGTRILEKIVISPEDRSYTPQDAWILKKT